MEQNDISRIMDLSDPDVLADNSEEQFQNVFRRHIKDNPKKELIARHKIWLSTIQHEYPMPYIPYRIGVYIRYHNQTKHDDYIEIQKLQRQDDIALCPAWTLVDFYVDNGARAPRMENSKEWCSLQEVCTTLLSFPFLEPLSHYRHKNPQVSRRDKEQCPPDAVVFGAQCNCCVSSDCDI